MRNCLTEKPNYLFVLLPILLTFTIGLIPLSAKAQLPIQTATEKHRQKLCLRRMYNDPDNFFTFPTTLTGLPGVPGITVYVIPEKFKKTGTAKKLKLMRDVACYYSGGRMNKDYWDTFSAYDLRSDKIMEVFPLKYLWPKSGRYP